MRSRWALAIVLTLAACGGQPVHEVTAKVIDIAPRDSRISPDWSTITVRTAAGLTATKSMRTFAVRCKVGDTVHAWARGIALTIDHGACA